MKSRGALIQMDVALVKNTGCHPPTGRENVECRCSHRTPLATLGSQLVNNLPQSLLLRLRTTNLCEDGIMQVPARIV
jgi:hypothetical protein